MKILLCNIALRSETCFFPPVACTSLCNVLLKAGYSTQFYNIDSERPSTKKLSEFFKVGQFDVIGISAVASTGYRYTKYLADLIKRVSPKVQVILGGNLAASYEVILRKCQIDICVIGEGEKVLLNLVKHWEKHGNFKPPNRELYGIKGISFLNSDGVCIFTGEEKLIDNGEISQPDYKLLDKFSDINQYILDPMIEYAFANDPRSYKAHRQGKKLTTLFTSKGCVNKCTFCHRWIKGYRVIPPKKVIATMRHLMDRYNASFFYISVECFAENKQWLEAFIKAVKPLDVLFVVGGARVSLLRKDTTVIQRLKNVGLTAINFGIESGSNKMLKIIEKNATPDENLAALKICAEAGVHTTIQLVIGMPGENSQTINETIEFIKRATGNLPYPPSISINYLQSLPGTPCYEFLRYHGFLGKTIEDEERYLFRVSDTNASDFKQYVNVSEEPLSKVKLWQRQLDLLPTIHWLKQHGWKFPTNQEKGYCSNKTIEHTVVSRIKLFLRSKATIYRIVDFMGQYFWRILLFKNRCSLYGGRKTFLITFGLIIEENRSSFKIGNKSLREILPLKKSAMFLPSEGIAGRTMNNV